MRKSELVRLLILFVAAMTLSGCVVWPYWWDDGGHHDRGGRDGGWHDRGGREGHRGYGDRD